MLLSFHLPGRALFPPGATGTPGTSWPSWRWWPLRGREGRRRAARSCPGKKRCCFYTVKSRGMTSLTVAASYKNKGYGKVRLRYLQQQQEEARDLIDRNKKNFETTDGGRTVRTTRKSEEARASLTTTTTTTRTTQRPTCCHSSASIVSFIHFEMVGSRKARETLATTRAPAQQATWGSTRRRQIGVASGRTYLCSGTVVR